MNFISSDGYEISHGDEVLVRNNEYDIWVHAIFSHKNNMEKFPFVTSCGDYKICVLYNKNSNLVGTRFHFRNFF